MITKDALRRVRILVFWERHELKTTLDAFPAKKRTLYSWKKKFEESGGRIESLNNMSRAPQKKRTRYWHDQVIEEIKRICWEHPNLGKEKIYPILSLFCQERNLKCPKEKTIGRIMKDLGGITQEIYDRKVKEYKEKQYDINIQLEEYTKADENYHIIAGTLFSLASRAWEIFESSEVEEKRQLLDFVLQNSMLKGRNLLFEVRSPFKEIIMHKDDPTVLRELKLMRTH